MRRRVGVAGGFVLAVAATATPVLAHGAEASVDTHGLAFGVVLGLTVALGVLGGVAALRWQRIATRRPAVPAYGVAALLVVLGGRAGVVAASRGLALAAVGVGVGGLATWTLRNRVAGGHHACDEAALGAVVTHRVVEGAVLAALYAANAALGLGAALVLAGHAAAETGAVVGLWSASRWRWAVLTVVQAGFVAGALGGAAVVDPLGAPVHTLVLALLGGALLAAGVAAESRRRRSALA